MRRWVRGRSLAVCVVAVTGACGGGDKPPSGEVAGTDEDTTAQQVTLGPDTAAFDPTLVDTPLTGTVWTLESVFGVAVPEGTPSTLSLDEETGRATGNTGCNAFTGPFEWVGTRLRLGAVTMTRMACPAGLEQVEVDLSEALRITGSYRIVRDRLELMSEQGGVAAYRARPPR